MTPAEKLPVVAAIKTFLTEQVLTGQVGNQMEFGIDVSDPHLKDMTAMRSGNFELRSVRKTPTSAGDTFHCYVGQTEMHFMGQAAAAIRAILDRDPQSHPQ